MLRIRVPWRKKASKQKSKQDAKPTLARSHSAHIGAGLGGKVHLTNNNPLDHDGSSTMAKQLENNKVVQRKGVIARQYSLHDLKIAAAKKPPPKPPSAAAAARREKLARSVSLGSLPPGLLQYDEVEEESKRDSLGSNFSQSSKRLSFNSMLAKEILRRTTSSSGKWDLQRTRSSRSVSSGAGTQNPLFQASDNRFEQKLSLWGNYYQGNNDADQNEPGDTDGAESVHSFCSTDLGDLTEDFLDEIHEEGPSATQLKPLKRLPGSRPRNLYSSQSRSCSSLMQHPYQKPASLPLANSAPKSLAGSRTKSLVTIQSLPLSSSAPVSVAALAAPRSFVYTDEELSHRLKAVQSFRTLRRKGASGSRGETVDDDAVSVSSVASVKPESFTGSSQEWETRLEAVHKLRKQRSQLLDF